MTDPRFVDTTGVREPEPTRGTPRWAKVFAIIATIVFVLFIITRFTIFAGM